MSINWTDIVVIIVLGILVGNGAYQGFLRSMVGPACLLVATAIGYSAYLTTHQPAVGIFIAFLGPILLTWGANSYIRAKYGDQPMHLTFLSQFSGAVVNVLWGGTILCLTLLIITLLPYDQAGLKAIKNDMNASITYGTLEKIVVKKQEKKKDSPESCMSGTCSMSPDDLEALWDDKDIQDLLNDPRIQKIINDPTLRETIQKKDIASLLGHPALMELAQDPSLMAKFFKVYPKIKARMNDPLGQQ